MLFLDIPLFPPRASSLADRVDLLFLFLVAVTGAVALMVTVLVIGFSLRYRRRLTEERTPRILGSLRLELFWTITPFLIFLVMFIWGASIYIEASVPPADSMEVYVVGKQWMWKVQHAEGVREQNELHVPVGRPILLTLTSEDVIHDFFVPAFRNHVDVVPGRYGRTWFLPDRVGDYHLFCSQYCGTDHAGMVGWVHVMSRSDYDDWLNGELKKASGSAADGSLALQGRQLFLKLQCVTCHTGKSTARAPSLEGLFNTTVQLSNGPPVRADEKYIHDSILYPELQIVEPYKPIMPTFKGQVTKDDLIRLIAYIKTLGPGQTPDRTEDFPPPIGAPTKPEGQAPQP